jgi:uncharacterized protein (TIGR04255 family)
LAVQFDEPRLDSLDIASVGDRVKGDLPKREEQPSRPPMEERFDEAPEPFRLEVLDALPPPRIWFLSDDDSRLLQVQHDLVAYNWRRMSDSDDYPHYGDLRSPLAEHLRITDTVAQEAGKSPLHANWCEVSYVNHVPPARGSSERLPLDELMAVVRPLGDKAFLPAPEDNQFAARFRIGSDDRPIGRLTVSVSPGIRTSDARPIWSLNLTARVMSEAPTRQAALEALDVGHEWAVRGFSDLTTPRMHKEWGLQEESR